MSELADAVALYTELLIKLKGFQVVASSEHDGDDNWIFVGCNYCHADLFPDDQSNTRHGLDELARAAFIHVCASTKKLTEQQYLEALAKAR